MGLINSIPFTKEGTNLELPERIEPGKLIKALFSTLNESNEAAQNVTLNIQFPEGLEYAPGSASLNGRSMASTRVSFGQSRRCRVQIGTVRPGERVDVEFGAYATAPADCDSPVHVVAEIASSEHSRTVEATGRIDSRPEFIEDRNELAFSKDSVATPGQPVRASLSLVNDGTMIAYEVVAKIGSKGGLRDISLISGYDAEIAEGDVHLGNLVPGDERKVELELVVPNDAAVGTSVRLTAEIAAAGETLALLESADLPVKSLAQFSESESRVERASQQPVRPGDTFPVLVRVKNEGDDTAVRPVVSLRLPDYVFVETRERSADITLDDIGPGRVSTATVPLRVMDAPPEENAFTVCASISGDSFTTCDLKPLRVEMAKQVSFSPFVFELLDGEPLVDQEFGVKFETMNDGNVSVEQVAISLNTPPELEFIPGSLKINGFLIRDDAFEDERGILLYDVDRGAIISLTWKMLASRPTLRNGETTLSASVVVDGQKPFLATMPGFKIHPKAKYPDDPASLPFRIPQALFADGMVQLQPASNTRALAPAMAESAKMDEVRPEGINLNREDRPSSSHSIAPDFGATAESKDGGVGPVESPEPQVAVEASMDSPSEKPSIFASEDTPSQAVASAFSPKAASPLFASKESVSDEEMPEPIEAVDAPQPIEEPPSVPEPIEATIEPSAQSAQVEVPETPRVSTVTVTRGTMTKSAHRMERVFKREMHAPMLAHIVAMRSLLPVPLPEQFGDDELWAKAQDHYERATRAFNDTANSLLVQYIPPQDGESAAPLDTSFVNADDLLEAMAPFAIDVVADPAWEHLVEMFPSLKDSKPSMFASIAALATRLGEGYQDHAAIQALIVRYRNALIESFGILDPSSLDEFVTMLNDDGLDEAEQIAWDICDRLQEQVQIAA